jgi:hypothetical protein
MTSTTGKYGPCRGGSRTIWPLAQCTDSGGYPVTVSATGPDKFVVSRVSQYGGPAPLRQGRLCASPGRLAPDPPEVWSLRMTRSDGENFRRRIDDLMMVLKCTCAT